MMKIKSHLFLLSFCFIANGFIAGLAHSEEQLTPEKLIENMRQGGYVLYMRHAASNRSQTDTNTQDLSNCATQRNLSTQGREQAKAIGQSIKSLNIPIASVISSPYCRCVDTAQLAFGRVVKSDDLRFTISEDEAETKRLSSALQKRLSTPPPAGTNTVIVAHTGNLKEAAKVWPKPEGVLHVFKPMGKGKFKHLGRIAPDEWPKP